MHLIFLSLLFLIPSTRATVDCRSACHDCHAKQQPKEILEIYCAMCNECKERRKERLKAKIHLAQQAAATTTEKITLSGRKIDRSDDHNGIYVDHPPVVIDSLEGPEVQGEHSKTAVIQEIPPGCPTAPPCSDDEAPETTTTTTTTTTPRPTCPPLKPCKKKTTPCMPCCPMPCAVPCYPYPLTCPYSSSTPYPYLFSTPYPKNDQSPQPNPLHSFQGPPPDHSPQGPPSNHSPQGPATHPPQIHEITGDTAPHAAPPGPARSKSEADYVYMYVGVPKNILRRNGKN